MRVITQRNIVIYVWNRNRTRINLGTNPSVDIVKIIQIELSRNGLCVESFLAGTELSTFDPKRED